MYNIYKLILTFLIIAFFTKEGTLYGQVQCSQFSCQRLDSRTFGSGQVLSNILAGNVTCYDSLAFPNATSLTNVPSFIGDSIYITLPNLSSYVSGSVHWSVRVNNTDILANVYSDILVIPVNALNFPNCSQMVRIKMSGEMICNNTTNEVRGMMAFRVPLHPVINANSQRLNGVLGISVTPPSNVIDINSGDPLVIQEYSPLNLTSYSWSINGGNTISSNSLSINEYLPVGTHNVNITVTQPSTPINCNSSFVYNVTVNVANSCAIIYNNNTYNQLANNALSVSREVVQDDLLSFSAQGSSSTHSWIFEVVNPTTLQVVNTTTASGVTTTFNTNSLPPCDYILRVKYQGDNCLSLVYGVNINLKVHPKITVNGSGVIPLTTSYSLPMCSGGTAFSLTTPAASAYLWDINGQTSSVQTFNNITATPPSTINGSLTITPTANTMCSSTAPIVRNFQIQTVSNNGGYKVTHGTTTTSFTLSTNQNISMCEGETLEMESLLDGTYAWNTWENPVKTTKTISFNNLQSGVYSGRFSFISSATQGCTGQQTYEFTVTVNAKPEGYSLVSSKGDLNTSSKTLEVCAGTENIRLTVNCPNSTCPTADANYIWSYIDNASNLTTNTGQIYTINAPTNDLQYTIKLVNSLGCSSTDVLTVKPRQLPLPTITANNTEVCSGDTIRLSTSNAGSSSIRSYAWAGSNIVNGAANLQITNLRDVFALPENNTPNNTNVTLTYNVSITDNAGCVGSTSTQITVKPIWKGEMSPNIITDLCESDTLILVANCQNCNTLTVPPTYDWYINNSVGTNIPLPNTNNENTSISTLASTIKSIASSNFLVVLKANLNGCITTKNGVARQSIWDNPIITLDTIVNGGLCINNIITAVANPTVAGRVYNYQWTGGSATIQSNRQNYILSDTTIMKVRAFYNPVPQITCAYETVDTITVSSINNFTISASKASICRGETVTLSSSLVEPGASYKWYNNTNNTLITTSNTDILTVTPNITTEYRLDITTADSCFLSTTVEVEVVYGPTVVLAQPQAPLCPRQNVVVSALVSGGSGRYSYSWNGSGVGNVEVVTRIDSSTTPVTTTTLSVPSRYVIPVPDSGMSVSLSVQIVDSAFTGCIMNATIPIAPQGCTEQRLTINRSLNKEMYCVDDTIKVVAEVNDPTIANPIFYWSTGRIRNSTGGNTTDTLVLNGRMDLLDTMISVIVTNGEPEFKVKELKLINETKIVTINDNLADFTGSGNAPLTLHPSLMTNPNTNNELYTNSQLDIVIFKLRPSNSPNATLDTIAEVLFDNKYAGRIISQTHPTTPHPDTMFLTIRVQVPCMLATNPIPIMLVTPTGQLKRIPNSVRIVSSLPTFVSNPIVPQAIRTERIVSQADPALDSLPTMVRNLRDSVTARITSVVNRQGQIDFTKKIELELTIKARDNEANSGSGMGNRDRNFKVYLKKANSPDETEIKSFTHNLRDHPYTTSIDLTGINSSDLPLTITMKRQDAGTGNPPWKYVDIYTDGAPDEELTAYTRDANIKINTIANIQYATGVYNLSNFSPQNEELTISDKTVVSDIEFAISPLRSNNSIANGKKYYQISLPGSIPIVNDSISDMSSSPVATNDITRVIWSGDIQHVNTNRAEQGKQLIIEIPKDSAFIGTTSNVVYGPMIVTHMSFSDYVFNKTISPTNYVSNLSNTAQLNDSLVNILIDSTLYGKTGHVCLYEMGTINTPNNYVYISSSNKVIDFKGQNGSNNTRDQEFRFVVERPFIDSLTASADTVCSEQLTVLKAFASKMPNASYSWSATPALSPADANLLASMNLDSVYIYPKRTATYKATATSQYGCKAEASIDITVNALPYSNIDANNAYIDNITNRKTVKFCENSSVTLFGIADSISCGGNCHYQWEKLNNVTWSDIGNTEYVNRNNEEMIRLSISINGCYDYDTIRLVKHTPPTVELDVPENRLYMCDGRPVTISVRNPNPLFNYKWNNNVTYPSLEVLSQGGYYVEVTDTNSCTASSNPVIVLNTTLGKNSVITGRPAIVCGNTPAILDITPCRNCTYTWYKREATSAIVVRPSSNSTMYSTTVEGTYYAIVKNEQGCEFLSANEIEVTSSSLVTPNIVSSATSLCNNSVITITGPSLANYTYKWYYTSDLTSANPNFTIMSASTTNTITVRDAGKYKLQVMLGNSCTSESNVIEITDTVFTPTLDPSDPIICDGSYLTLSTPLIIGAQYQWYLNGVPLANAIMSTYDATTAGNYYVRVTNPNGCSANTSTRTLNVSSVSSPVASSDVTSFCPGDSVRLAVTLCPGCQYQWYRDGIAVGSLSANNYVYYVNTVGRYNVRVYDQYGTCNVLSNTLVLDQNNAPIPSIATTTSEICNNVLPVLQTTSCVGCSYTWMENVSLSPTTTGFQPIFGAPDDTLYTVAGRGEYQVRVKYPNGCQVNSSTLTVNDGSFTASISLDSVTPGFSAQICNNSPIRLQVSLSDPSRCTGNCTYQWFRGGARLFETPFPYYEPPVNERLAGNYQVRVITGGGCMAESQTVYVPSIVLAPTITASASALCGTTPVVLAITNCPNNDCSNTSVSWSSGQTTPTITVNNQQSYTATVTLASYHCSAVTPPIALNSLQGLGTRITFATGTNSVIDTATASICETTNVQMIRTNTCSTCTYQWIKDTLSNPTTPVLTATLPTLSTNIPGRYALIARDPNNNCRDTSNYLVLNKVNRDSNLLLQFSPNNVLAATGSPVDLDVLGAGLSPNNLHNTGIYTSTPLFAYTPNTAVNPGLTTPSTRQDIFNPSAALSGNYLITYTYTTDGCSFTTSDILTVKDGGSVTISNRNPSHVSYEACVTDTVVISTTNYPFRVDSLYLLNQVDAYQSVSIVNTSMTIDSLGTDWVYNQSVTIVIPSWAKGSFIRLAGYRSNGNHEAAMTPYLMVHNEPLSITGLPTVICSNGNQIAVSGSPAGGIFTILPASANPLVDSIGFAGVFNGNLLNPTLIPQSIYNTEGVADLQVAYRSYSKFTNGLNCPQPDIVTELVEARAVVLNSVTFHPISVSQQREELVRLVNKVTPYTSSPSRWLVNSATNNHAIGFGGGYTTPAGAPTHFLAANAGEGAHIIQYSISNGVCQNTVSNILQVLPAPTAIAINDTICRNINPVIFGRDAAYQYSVPNPAFFQGIAAYRDTVHVMRVTTAESNRYITTVNPSLGLEQFRYTPRDNNPLPQIVDDSLLIEYIFKRKEYDITNGSYSQFDTTSYVVASFKIKINIEDTLPVMIRDTADRVLCEIDRDRLVAGSPMGGVFSLKGGSGAYANEAVLVNNILNTHDIHHTEAGITNYVLAYEYNGVACRSRDTFNFSIPSPLNASFVIPNNIREYCHSDAPITLLPATTNAASTTLLVNGVAQQGVVFTPSNTTPGQQTLELRLSDAYGCETSHTEMVTVHSLPQLDMRNFINNTFCTNDEPFSFTITPSPTCVGATGGELIDEDFDSPILPSGWNIINNHQNASSWAQYAYPGTNGVVFIDTTSNVQDAWIFTRPIAMQAGTTYQIEYLLRVGDDCPNCDPAAMEVKVGRTNTPGGQDMVLGTYPEMDNNYGGFFDWYNNTFIAPASGNYYFSFHANARPTAPNRVVRTIAMDKIIIRQISPTNCLTGIGSLSGGGIVATSGNDSVYTFVPASAQLGRDTIRYVFADMNGCIDSIVKPIEINQHPLITMTPLDSTYCWNEQPIDLEGTPVGGVFSIRRLDNNTGSNLQMNGNAVNNITYNTSVPLVLLPHVLGVEEIQYNYRDPLSQCATIVRDTVTVIGIPDSVRFLSRISSPNNASAFDTLYCEYATPVTLFVESVRGSNITTGTFYGAGVLNGSGNNTGGHGVAQFSPSVAVTTLNRVGYDTLSYVYTATNGCVDTTRQVVRIEPRPTLSFTHNDPLHMLGDSICENDDPLLVLVRHTQYTIDPLTRELTYVDSLLRYGVGTMTSLPAGLLVLGDTLKPGLFGPGLFTMNYAYTNEFGCSNSISKQFRVNPKPIITYNSLPADRIYCENEEGNFIYVEPAYYPGSGYLEISSVNGVETLNSSFTYIDPATLADINGSIVYILDYHYTTPQGCSDSKQDSFRVNPYPRIDISSLPTAFCSGVDSIDLYNYVTPQTGIFTDNLHTSSILSNHYLNLEGAPGPRRIVYHVHDAATTCSNVDSQTVTLYTVPLPSFEAFGNCEGDEVRFEGSVTLDPAFDNITEVRWRYGDGNEDILAPNATNPLDIPSSLHFYNSHGYFYPTLTVVNNGACSTTVSRELVVSQAVAVNDLTGPYSNNFENNALGWYPQDENAVIGTSSIWSHTSTSLAGNHIYEPNVNNTAWITYADPANNVYERDVRSYLYTPCFDMTQMWKPMVSMDLWLDMIHSIDGATFEYYDRATSKWKVLGEHNPEIGVNWYNSDFIASRPGAYKDMPAVLANGWTGQDWINPVDSSKWMNARYRLDQFAGHNNVQFRIAFATSPSTILFNNPQGMSLDNFWLGERSRNILVEHFAHYNYPEIDYIDNHMYNSIYNNNYGRDVHLIQYNTEKIQGTGPVDSLYLNTPSSINMRMAQYSYQTQPNHYLLNGEFRDDSLSKNMRPIVFEEALLMTPKYLIFEPIITADNLGLNVRVNALGNMESDYEDVRLYVVITEDSIPNQGTSIIRQNSYKVNAQVRLIYGNQGLDISGPNWVGKPITTGNLFIPYSALNVHNRQNINVVAFIQDANTREVYQVNSNKNRTIYLYDLNTPTTPTGVEIIDETSTLKLYPNPTTERFTVELSKALETDHDWMLVDALGRTLRTGKAAIGTMQFAVKTDDLPSGSYIFVIKNETVWTQRQVIVVRP